ncbi:hypothetical protein BLNAU_13633 [Blattamonas nauphoetae]|uniref:Calcineurin-like phosphoesterase domain-containing protein n=1 Tax=Blattamonas nauphoetae TaxID=2049346 RepID=A0ABQ9XMJ0_9EUKA|nr:hypothetical protein BLNAU_13633 [Blattamonas nauphoetae]
MPPNTTDWKCNPPRLTIVGDPHGNLESLTSVLLINRLPSDSTSYHFLGEYADRDLSSNVDYNSADDLCQRFLGVFFSIPLAAVCYPSSTHLTAPSTPNPSPLSVHSCYFSSPRWSMADPTASPVPTPINLEAAAKNGYDPLAGRGVLFVHGGLPFVGTDGIPLQRLTLHDIERVDCYRILAQKHGYSAMWQTEESTLPSPSPRQSAMLVDSPQLTPAESARMKQQMEILAAKPHPRNQRSASPRTTRIMHKLLWNVPSAHPTADLASPLLPSHPSNHLPSHHLDLDTHHTAITRRTIHHPPLLHITHLALRGLHVIPLTISKPPTSISSSHPFPALPSSTIQKPLHAVPVFHFQELDAGIPAPSPNIAATPSSYVVHELGIAPPVPFTQDSTIGTDTGLTEAARPSLNTFNREWLMQSSCLSTTPPLKSSARKTYRARLAQQNRL